MDPARRSDREAAAMRLARDAALIGASLVAATVAAAALEGVAGIADASPVYLLPVVLAASLLGTWPAIATSALGFLAYDFLFTTPRFTLAVADAGEWLSLLLFLSVAVVIGRLTALLRERADEADRRSRESISLATIARAIAMQPSFEDAAVAVVDRLRVDAEMESLEIVHEAELEPVVVARAGSADREARTAPWTLLRSATDGSSDWVRIVGSGREPTPIPEPASVPAHSDLSADLGAEIYLVPIEADGVRLGAIRAIRPPTAPRPGRGARRILAVTADQLGMAIRRDALRAEITAVEVERQGDLLRRAILDSVSHDLRTPLATIRALAGGLVDEARTEVPGDVRTSAVAIDAEAERLADLVRGLLDMSRIQAGTVRPDVEPHDVADLVQTTVRRLADEQATGRIALAIPQDLPPVLVDAVLFDVALANVLGNALRYAPAPAPIVVSASHRADAAAVELDVDDGGPGVPDDLLGRLFDRFYRVAGPSETARHGLGMGLAISRGFVEAMDGAIEARRSDLGGLRISVRLPAGSLPPEDDAEPGASVPSGRIA